MNFKVYIAEKEVRDTTHMYNACGTHSVESCSFVHPVYKSVLLPLW